jgi:chorismate mutase
LNELRNEIDVLDKTVWALLNKRFALSEDIARIKHDLGLPIFDAKREKRILADIKKIASEQQISFSIARLYELLFVLSRAYQQPWRQGRKGRNAAFNGNAGVQKKSTGCR